MNILIATVFFVWYATDGTKHISNVPPECIKDKKLVISSLCQGTSGSPRKEATLTSSVKKRSVRKTGEDCMKGFRPPEYVETDNPFVALNEYSRAVNAYNRAVAICYPKPRKKSAQSKNEETIAQLEKKLKETNKKLEDALEEIADAEREIADAGRKISNAEWEISDVKRVVDTKDSEISSLQRKVEDLEDSKHR